MIRLDEEPDWLQASGWQRTDGEHPPDAGEPAYRAVYKTLRIVVPTVEFAWPNLLVRLGHGTVDRGGMNVPGAVPSRRPRHWVLPEAGRLVPAEPGELRYEPEINMQFSFAAWQDKLEDVFFAEFLLKTEAAEAAAQLIEGRRKLATLTTMLDLRFGRRLLGLRLAEEAGAVFPDWHFARSLSSELLGAESQLAVAAIQPDGFADWARTDMDRYMRRPESDKERLGLAADWYWTAIHSEEPVTQFLHLWFAVEVVAMPDTTNVRPVRERLARVAGGAPQDWAGFVGRLFGKRSLLVHGEEVRRVSPDELAGLRSLVELLLAAELGRASPEMIKALRKPAGLDGDS